jgi:sialic acid synthase SpsE
LKIGHLDISERVLVVAEAGNNHEGDFGRAKEMVDAAADSGVQAIKFQTFRPEHYVSRLDEARFEQLSRFALSFDQFAELAERARTAGLLFMSTAFDLGSADFLAGVADAIKIASGDNDFAPLIRRAAASDLPLVISTGLLDEDGVAGPVGLVEAERGGGDAARLVLLHCVSAYPAEPAALNLRAIPGLAERYGHPVGYSDHALGNEAAVLAVAQGARVVEKHFTLGDPGSGFRDHALSADPGALGDLVARVAAAEEMLGSPHKRVMEPERELAGAVRRSVVAATALPEGHELRAEDVTYVRPAGGLSPGDEEPLLGGRLKRALAAGERIAAADVTS